MRTIIIPEAFKWEHEKAPKDTHRIVTFEIWVRDMIEATKDFGQWPNTAKALRILRALEKPAKVDGKIGATDARMKITLEEEDYQALKKALHGMQYHPAYSIALATAGFQDAIEDAKHTK
jgi:hypothetical protein